MVLLKNLLIRIGSFVGVIFHSPLSQDAAAAALYVTAKPSAYPVSPRSILVVFEYLTAITPDFTHHDIDTRLKEGDWHLTAAQYEAARDKLYRIEAQMLRILGFQTQVSLPYTLCINYLQSLDAFTAVDL